MRGTPPSGLTACARFPLKGAMPVGRRSRFHGISDKGTVCLQQYFLRMN